MKHLISLLVLLAVSASAAPAPIPRYVGRLSGELTTDGFFGTNTVTAQLLLTNRSIFSGAVLTHASGAVIGNPSIGANDTCVQIVTSGTLSDLTISNNASIGSLVGLVTVGTSPTPIAGNFDINNCKFYSENRGLGIAGPTGIVRDTLVSAKGQALETRGSHATFYNSSFDSYGGSPESFAIAYQANDLSTNVFNRCTFIARNGTDQNTVLYAWTTTDTEYNYCDFHVASTSASKANGYDGIINMSESETRVVFNYCTFDLTYTNAPVWSRLGFYENENGQRRLELNYCYYYPETNGVIFDVSNLHTGAGADTLIVRGGNLRPENFSDPSAVTFYPAASMHYKSVLASDDNNSTTTLKTSSLSVDVVAGRKYLITGKIALSENVAADGAKIDLYGAGAYGFTYYNVQGTFLSTALNSTTRMGAPDSVISASTFTGTGMLEISGTAYFSQAHPLTLRFAQNAHSTGTLTLLKGSYLQLTDITD